MTLEKENIYNKIGEDLNRRNRNWEKLKEHPARLKKAEEDIQSTENRLKEIITTPIDGAAAAQELVDARQGAPSLGDNLAEVKSTQQVIQNDLDLKTAKTNRELQQLGNALSMVNINQEAKQTVEGADVISLPKNAGEGAGTVGLEGLTVTNLVENGDFRDESKYWSGTNTSVEYTSEGELKLVGLGSYNNSFALQQISTIVGDTYYSKTTVKISGGGARSLQLRMYSDDFEEITSPRADTWHTLSGLLVGKEYSKDIRVRQQYPSAEDNLNKIMLIKDVQLINLTQTFGAGNEPSKEWCDAHLADYVDGTKSVATPKRIKSVGKNLFDESVNFTLGRFANSSGVIYNNNPSTEGIWLPQKYIYSGVQWSGITCLDYYRVKKGRTYKLSYKHSSVEITYEDLILYDNKKTPLSHRSGTTQVVAKQDGYIRFSISKSSKEDLTISDIQLEEHVLATSYTPHTASHLYLNNDVELRSLPNGVKDEIRPDGKGGYELVKRVGVFLINSYTSFRYGGSGLMALELDKNHIENIAHELGQEYAVYDKKVVNVFDTNNSVRIAVSDDAFDGGDEAFNYFKNKSIYYQLATPEIIPLSTSGNLTTYPGGTVYFENVIADAGMYTEQFTALHSYPIKEIESLNKLSADGTEVKLDTSKAEITGNTFTHPDLARNDIVFVEYHYHSEQPIGKNSVEHYDSRYTIKDTANDKFYQWNITATNGVPDIGLEEV